MTATLHQFPDRYSRIGWERPIHRPRAEMVELMAADLARLDAYGTEPDAFRTLMNLGTYFSFEVAMFLDDARQRAFQIVEASVAMAMAEED